MSKNKGTKLRAGLIIAILISTIFGIALYHLSQIPFGIIFDIILYLFLISLVLVLILMALLCFRAAQHGLRWLGVIPVLLAIVVVMLILIIKIDYRMLYFKSLPPHPSKAEWIEDLHYLADRFARRAVQNNDIAALVKEVSACIGKPISDIPPSSSLAIFGC